MALLRGPAMEPGSPRPPLTGHHGSAQRSTLSDAGGTGATTGTDAGGSARPRPRDCVPRRSGRCRALCVRVADPPVQPSIRGGSPDSPDSCPVVPCSCDDLTRAINLCSSWCRSSRPDSTSLAPMERWTPPVCWYGAPVAQWIEHLTTDQKVGGSTPSRRAGQRPFFHQPSG